MKLIIWTRYTLIYVLCFSMVSLASTTANIESKIGDSLRKESHGRRGCTDRPEQNPAAQQQDELSVAKRIQFHVALTVLDKMNKAGTPLDHIVHVKASQLRPNTYSPLRQKYPNQDLDISLGELLRAASR